MKIKVSLLITAVSILKSIDTTKMKLSTSYKVRQILNACEDAVQDFEAKRVSIAEAHGTLNEAKTQYDFKDGSAKAEFQKKLQEVMDDDIDIKITKIPVDLLDDYITIEPTNIPYVEWFISGLK